ncbi:hemopexin [Eublepharis macularius]|uniref:Hemopexin n=1 Tax=Eublepharis macularius TaxID=481883 RepID=A0AA97KSN5_EUBMA|nr:hemopexin [Eublepharis macularius]
MLGALCLAWSLALGLSYPQSHGRNLNATGSWHHLGSAGTLDEAEVAQRCADEGGFDAVTLDETGTMLFFKGDVVWKGFTGPAEPINASWPEIHGPVDAALRIHRLDHPDVHDNVFLFRGKRVWAYAQGKLRGGYPKLIEKEFKGVPGDLDAAVECHPKECAAETILFFKGSQVLSYDLKTGVLKEREWPAVANCSSAVRWLERYYCFQGIRFVRFDPVTGSVPPRYPLDARDYFMRCPGRGHGHEVRPNATVRARYDRCSGQPFQAFSSDDSGRIYAFRGGLYFRLDSHRDGWHPWALSHTWKEMQGEVDAAFSWEDKLYLVQGSQVTIYRSGQGYSLVEGYPRPLQAELGVASVDAAFTCPHSHDLYLIQGSLMQHVDLLQRSRGPDRTLTPPHSRVDGAFCTAKGVYLFQGSSFYHYASVNELVTAAVPAAAQDTATTFFQCPATGGEGGPQRPPHQG